MSAFDDLIACAGSWRGTNVLQDPYTNTPAESASAMTVTPLLENRFVRLAYTWAWGDAPYEGEMLLGYLAKDGAASMYWIDSLHMDRKVMTLTGTAAGDVPLSLLGSYAAPDGENWGWRIEVAAAEPGRALRIVMHNIWPTGQEDLAVEMTYTPA
jgi:hypothetical protein